ncbi:shikimate dehydrogenase [Lysinibacillus sphaericus]|uniref:Shikimate dehydrogenase (NADP(+)) n=3 Tax=Lysinibacillus TaxID=400634 RepID=AROE_LYSSC|nr:MULTISPECIES: shikimate dehydrogenase [Lysinibacillus]B1HUI4.1 RecName: Full=Shikimate dehydrogenase (NADP(+)); Short=SDH [Lysinibacillus sphaericus C3-41]MBE5082891.1 shikimate dehydrogenase [Bacillus thuringiensis]ACA41329.1 Shikimate dehydrogenase [Lysinibacillus sphaericus C3-41]AMO32773.1 shikimate dehydrogenase [Lysinibacillus sphaericus]AMR92125.1 shikimate dehydrogenase [Lysinibacillus sphaericus]ANA46173.1 shikimate dehydrogenase [Lysinibacillus sphaericus]
MKKWFAVIGDPIEHSKSPAMHNAWFEEMSVEATYIPLHVSSEQLGAAVAGLKTLGASGWNVTIPHKTAIIPYLDELDELAQKMGAVNTVVRTTEGKLIGYNTDGVGFVRSLEEAVGSSHKDKPVLLVGAGGAARGIAFAMQQQGYSDLTMTNRTVANAQAIVDEMGIGRAISLKEAEETLAHFSIIVQMTSAGLATGNFSMPFSLNRLAKGAIVADIVYNPLMTPFLQAAEEKGATIVTGLGMFVHQGAIAFEHWLGDYPNTNSMIVQLNAQLGGN